MPERFITAYLSWRPTPVAATNVFNPLILTAYVTDASGNPVTGLRKENFKVFVNLTRPGTKTTEVKVLMLRPYQIDPSNDFTIDGIYQMELDFKNSEMATFTFVVVLINPAPPSGTIFQGITIVLGQTLVSLTKLFPIPTEKMK